jgi:hypothetical protein
MLRRSTSPPRITSEPITQDHRLTLLRRVLTDAGEPLRTRVAACLVLPYAQPVSRLTRLTIDDVLHDGGQTLLRFGDPPSPVPEPFAALLNQLTTGRANMNTAANPTARWLFPAAASASPSPPGALLPSLRPRHLRHPGPHRRPPRTRPPGTRPRHRPGPRLQPRHHPQAPRRRRRNLEPLPPAPERQVTGSSDFSGE